MRKLKGLIALATGEDSKLAVVYNNDFMDAIHGKLKRSGTIKRSSTYKFAVGLYTGIRTPVLTKGMDEIAATLIRPRLLPILAKAKLKLPEDAQINKLYRGETNARGLCYAFTFTSKETGKGLVLMSFKPDSSLMPNQPKKKSKNENDYPKTGQFIMAANDILKGMGIKYTSTERMKYLGVANRRIQGRVQDAVEDLANDCGLVENSNAVYVRKVTKFLTKYLPDADMSVAELTVYVHPEYGYLLAVAKFGTSTAVVMF